MARSQEGVRGVKSSEEGAQENALEGKGPGFDNAWTEVSARACWKQPITQRKKYDNSNAGYGSVPRCSVSPAWVRKYFRRPPFPLTINHLLHSEEPRRSLSPSAAAYLP